MRLFCRLFVHSSVDNWKKCIASVKLADAVLAIRYHKVLPTYVLFLCAKVTIWKYYISLVTSEVGSSLLSQTAQSQYFTVQQVS